MGAGARPEGVPTKVNYAKRTQFPPWCRSGDRRSRGRIAQNKPDFRRTGLLLHSNVQNEPNFRQAAIHCSIIPVFQARAYCGKRTQFPPRCRAGDRRSREPNVRNKPNFDGSRIGAKPFAGKELCCMYRSDLFSKTKPIPGAPGRRGSGCVRNPALRRGRPGPTRANAELQTRPIGRAFSPSGPRRAPV